MIRRFFLLLLIFVAYIVWRLVGRKKEDPDMGWRKFSRVHKRRQRFSGGGMVKDPNCETYIPKDKAIELNGHYFCSKECADQWSLKAKTS